MKIEQYITIFGSANVIQYFIMTKNTFYYPISVQNLIFIPLEMAFFNHGNDDM